MNKRQKYALLKPVESIFAPVDPNYTKTVTLGEMRLSTIVTVEPKLDGGGYQWHASVKPLGPDNRPMGLIGNVSVTDARQAMDFAMGMLDGVGRGKLSTIPPGEGGFHLFKDLSQDELAKVRRRSPANN